MRWLRISAYVVLHRFHEEIRDYHEYRRRNMAQKRSRRFNVEDVEFVHNNYMEMTAAEIAASRKLSLFQINKIVSDLRKAGIELPRKSPRRVNPVKAYVANLGGDKPAKATRKSRK